MADQSGASKKVIAPVNPRADSNKPAEGSTTPVPTPEGKDYPAKPADTKLPNAK